MIPSDFRKMNPVAKEKWLVKLRDPNAVQGQRYLARFDSDGVLRQCCLGLLCEVAVEEGVIPPPTRSSFAGHTTLLYGIGNDQRIGVLPQKVQDWAGVSITGASVHPGTRDLTELNDQAGWTFTQIADLVEENA